MTIVQASSVTSRVGLISFVHRIDFQSGKLGWKKTDQSFVVSFKDNFPFNSEEMGL